MHIGKVGVDVLEVHGVVLSRAGVLGLARAAVRTRAGAVGALGDRAITGPVEAGVLERPISKLRAGLLGAEKAVFVDELLVRGRGQGGVR